MAEDNPTPKPYGYIYLITNLVNGKVYVGQTTVSIDQRWKGHCNGAKYNPSHPPICSAIKKYGPQSFSIAEIGRATCKEDLDCKEGEAVLLYESRCGQHGYNIRLGGNGGGRLSKETREKLRLKLLGKTPPNKGKPMPDKQREWLLNYWREHDRPLATQEEKAIMSAASVEFWSAPANRKKQSEIIKARWADPEFTARMSAQRKIARSTPEARAKNSAAQMAPDVRSRKSVSSKSQWSDPEFAAMKVRDANLQWSDPERRRKMMESFGTSEAKANKSAAQLKRFAAMSPEERISKHGHRKGLPMHESSRAALEVMHNTPELVERRARIVSMRNSGMKWKDIAAAFGKSVSAMMDIYSKYSAKYAAGVI